MDAQTIRKATSVQWILNAFPIPERTLFPTPLNALLRPMLLTWWAFPSFSFPLCVCVCVCVWLCSYNLAGECQNEIRKKDFSPSFAHGTGAIERSSRPTRSEWRLWFTASWLLSVVVVANGCRQWQPVVVRHLSKWCTKKMKGKGNYYYSQSSLDSTKWNAIWITRRRRSRRRRSRWWRWKIKDRRCIKLHCSIPTYKSITIKKRIWSKLIGSLSMNG